MNNAAIQNWKRIIQQWRKSGLTKAEFCRQKKITKCQFSYHTIKHKAFSRDCVKNNKRKVIPAKHKSFAEVVCKTSTQAPIAPATSLILRLDCGGSIELSAGFDAEILKCVLKTAASL